MTNIRFLYDNWFDAATVTAESAATGFPVSNTQHIWKTRHWRSTGATSSWLKWDLATPRALTCVAFAYTNLIAACTVTIQANDSDVWTSPAFTQALVLTNSPDPLIAYFTAAQTYQWWRLLFTHATHPDGYFRVGRPFGGTWWAPVINFSNAYALRQIDPSKKNYSLGGQLHAYKLAQYKTLRFEWSEGNPISAADKAVMEIIYRDYVGQFKPYFLTRDADASLTTTHYVENVSDWEWRHIFMDNFYAFAMDVKESQ